jgi:UDP-glucose 4-epimerase
MTVLVTGGTGLVGSRLLRHFVEDGIECRALVRAGKQVPAGVARVEGDLLFPESLKESLEGITAVVHLAAVFRTPDEDEIWRANLDGTRNLIAAVKEQTSEARFIMTSTALVYSNETMRPGLEDDRVEPKLAYPASKVAAEKELRESGLNWSILRLGFVYGDGDEHLASIPKLAPAHKLHPAQTFSMIHQRDVAGAIKLALTGAADEQIVNVTDDAPTSIYEMARVIGATIDGSNEPLTNPWMGRMDGSKLRSLGFRPTIPTVYQAAEAGIL